MSQLSRRYINKNIEDRIQNLFLDSLILCSNKDDTTSFINDLLTPTEKIMLAKRLSIAYLLIKGYTYRTIRDFLKVSTPTIGSVALMLKIKGNGLRKIIEKLSKQKQWQNIIGELGNMAIELIGTGKGSNWSATKSILYKRKLSRKSPL